MSKNIVPIVFAFDNNLVMPACIAISSLMMHANEDTFYDIFILHSATHPIEKEKLDKLPRYYNRCRLTYREVGNYFNNAFEIRGITTPAYYRLLIPELIPEYDKVIYSDVDIIFRTDLSLLYQTDISQYYVAATLDIGLNFSEDGKRYIPTIGIQSGEYLQSGFIVLNSKRIREAGLVAEFKSHATKNYKYQDQDILNIVCRGKVLYLPPQYNVTDYSSYFILKDKAVLKPFYTDEELRTALQEGNIHFNGHKPWKKYSVNFDLWWEYYRKSPFFDEQFYFDFFFNRLNELDQLSLWKRIKILIRYFVYGKRKI